MRVWRRDAGAGAGGSTATTVTVTAWADAESVGHARHHVCEDRPLSDIHRIHVTIHTYHASMHVCC